MKKEQIFNESESFFLLQIGTYVNKPGSDSLQPALFISLRQVQERHQIRIGSARSEFGQPFAVRHPEHASRISEPTNAFPPAPVEQLKYVFLVRVVFDLIS